MKTGHRARKTKEPLNEYGLTMLQEQFCQAYLLRFNISYAARLTGISVGKAEGLMQNIKIRERINRIRIETGKAYDVTREHLMQELMKIVFSDLRNLQGNDIVNWPDDDIAAVAGVDYNLMGDISGIKRWDKLKAIEMLNKMLGYNMPDVTKVIPGKAEPMNKEEVIEIAKQLKDLIK